MKCKYEQYQVTYKQHTYKIVVFPVLQDMWFYDAHPAEETYDVNGSTESMKEFAKCFAIAIADPQAIVFLPFKKGGKNNYNMVLSRHSVINFKPSVWYKIKPLMVRKNKVQNYILHYNAGKLQDFIRKGIGEKLSKNPKKEANLFVQKMLGDTVFCQYSLYTLYKLHDGILRAISEIENNEKGLTSCWGLGWVLSKSVIEKIKDEGEKKK